MNPKQFKVGFDGEQKKYDLPQFLAQKLAEENGEVYFFNDIYGHDQTLNAVLAKGPPYP